MKRLWDKLGELFSDFGEDVVCNIDEAKDDIKRMESILKNLGL